MKVALILIFYISISNLLWGQNDFSNYEKVLLNNLIQNNPITLDDSCNLRKVYFNANIESNFKFKGTINVKKLRHYCNSALNDSNNTSINIVDSTLNYHPIFFDKKWIKKFIAEYKGGEKATFYGTLINYPTYSLETKKKITIKQKFILENISK